MKRFFRYVSSTWNKLRKKRPSLAPAGALMIRLHFPAKVHQQLKRLKEKSGVANEIELIRAAFAALDMLIDQELAGSKLEFVEKDGAREEFSILGHLNQGKESIDPEQWDE